MCKMKTYIDHRYFCGTCKSYTGECNDENAFCVCGADDWVLRPSKTVNSPMVDPEQLAQEAAGNKDYARNMEREYAINLNYL